MGGREGWTGHHGTLPPPLGSLDMSGIILTTGTFWLRITMLYNALHHKHTTLSLLCPAFNISFLSFLSFSPLPAPANADLALHTKLFPTILRHEFISITKENTYQIVFVSLMYFFFLICRSAGLTAKRSLFWRAHPFMSGELLDRRERKIFDVMFHSEAQYENHDSQVTANHFITRP